MSELPDVRAVTAEPTVELQRKVMIAATAGTVIEWYDFFMYISVASAISANFFSNDNPAAANIFALLTFGTGYLVRPLGALVFGRIGDMIGRKHTFLTTILMMGFATVAVGLVPSYAAIGLWAPSILIFLRMIQGLALGGEYGGAATYIAEHAPEGRRGWLTSWLQTSAPIGFTLSMLLVYLTRSSVTAEAFNGWGWRLLFITSIFPLAVSVWIRLKLQESPLFLKMKSEGTLSKSPISDTLASWSSVKRVLIAMFAMVIPQSVLLVGAQIYSLVFLTGTAKVDPQVANLLVGASLMLALPAMVVFGKLSDRYGTKVFILTACLIGSVSYLPLYKALTFYANPALYNAQANVPVTVAADPSECSVQFNPVGTVMFTSGCDIVKNALVRLGAPCSNRAEAHGAIATVFVGPKSVPVAASGQAPDAKGFMADLKQALEQAGYPSRADTSAMNYPMIVLILVTLSTIAGMIFGPLASAMTDLFPPQVRYTSVSFSYHVGNGYFGGLLPAIATALQISTGDLYAGLYYVIIVAAVSFVIGLLCLRSEPSARETGIGCKRRGVITVRPYPSKLHSENKKVSSMTTHTIGKTSIRQVIEQRGPGFAPDFLFPDWDPAELETHKAMMIPQCFDVAQGRFIASIHTWVLKTPHHTILIDSCAGNDKHRPSLPRFHQLSLPFLDRLAEAGVSPETVDYVCCTHLHADHCGWNTRLIDGRWVPTFPNAKYIFSKAEHEHWSGPAGREGFSAGVYEDSVLPVVESGQAEIVDGEAAIGNGLAFRPTPGHSAGHVAIQLVDGGERGIFSGDIMHQPLQVYRPDWNSTFCEHQEHARASRRWLLEQAAEERSTVFTAHFANSSAGHVTRIGDRFDWRFV